MLFLLFPLQATQASIQKKPVIGINIAINKVISANEHPLLTNSVFLSYKNAINELYFLSPQHLLWVSQENPQINSALKLIATASDSGLNKEHYNLTLLQALWQQLSKQKETSYAERALLDTAVSINLIHFLSDLHFGRINPTSLKFHFDAKRNTLVLIPYILKAIKNQTVSQLAHHVEPVFPAYHQLKKQLLAYRNKQPEQAIQKLSYITSLHPEQTSQQILEIRQQLYLLGASTEKNNPSLLYDQKLLGQIKKFQFHHGLKQDGIIGKKTIRALNIPVSQYILKIQLALERFRWLPKIQPGPLVMVNIPALQLWAYNSENLDKTQILNMKVIVGKSKKNKSPVFTANMYYLEFSPYWNIPRSITVEEILPKLQDNPLYLEQQNMELVTGFHNKQPGLPYTEDLFEHLQSGSLKLRQRPGKGNALGKVKFIFPNNYNVYLHDTSSRHLFKKSKRDLSHGCIRVEKPNELASFLLKSKNGWDKEKILQAMHLEGPKQVRLKKSVPVIIYYSTASIVEDQLVFYEDIYDYDTKLSQALMEHTAIPLIPLPNIADRN